MQAKTLRSYIHILVICAALLLCILGGFLSVPIFAVDEPSILTLAGLQNDRCENIISDVLIMAYRPSGEHDAAFSDLQASLPAWEQGQDAFMHGNAELGVPSRFSDSVTLALQSEQGDFLAIDMAARAIAAHPEAPVDPVQLRIILEHRHGYFLAESQIIALFRNHSEELNVHLFFLETGIVIVLVSTLVGNYILVTRKSLRKLIELEELNSSNSAPESESDQNHDTSPG